MAGMRNRSSRNGKSRGRQNGSKRSNHSNNVVNLSAAKSNYDKFTEKAKEARTSGDRVSAENFLQYADHYKRIIIEAEEKKEALQIIEEENSKSEEKEQVTTNNDKNNESEEDNIVDKKNNIPEELLVKNNAT